MMLYGSTESGGVQVITIFQGLIHVWELQVIASGGTGRHVPPQAMTCNM
ncbi:MAG: hypothetical protein BroJett021_30270 [Chloroflexota bacterium]|jgi:hypothetical protein|nr:MAG: hypothetical protein BroJett021_30270 [Chloroflexota bacterium]